MPAGPVHHRRELGDRSTRLRFVSRREGGTALDRKSYCGTEPVSAASAIKNLLAKKMKSDFPNQRIVPVGWLQSSAPHQVTRTHR